MILGRRLKALFLSSIALALSCEQLLSAQQPHSISVGANYTYVRTNLLPGCNCFGLQGGGAEAQYSLTPHIALLADFTATHKGNITINNYDLTQITYAGGLRYQPLSRHTHFQPFGDVLLGGAHTSGSLAPNATGYGGANAFLFELGGGLAIPIGKRWTVVPVRATYQLTTFSNGQDNRQNNLRISAGIRLHIGRH